MMVEELACWLCERDGVDPNEIVHPLPAGPPQRMWKLYEPGALWLAEGLPQWPALSPSRLD